MLERAILLKEAIIQYITSYPDNKFKDNILTNNEWVMLNKIKAFLEKLKFVTKAIKSLNLYLNIVLSIIDFVLSKFKAVCIKFVDNLILGLMFNY